MFFRDCFPINIPAGDPYYPSNKTCLNFVRSTATPALDCSTGIFHPHQLFYGIYISTQITTCYIIIMRFFRMMVQIIFTITRKFNYCAGLELNDWHEGNIK
jgi:hypothetical protein